MRTARRGYAAEAARPTRRRPACAAAVAFAGGLIAAHYFALPVWPLVAAAAFLAAAAAALNATRIATWLALAAVAAGAAGWYTARAGYLGSSDILFSLDRHFLPRDAVVVGVVADDPLQRPYGTTFTLGLESITAAGRTRAAGGRASVSIYENVALRYGDRLAVRGAVVAPKPARNPNGFDYRSYLRRRGITALIRVRRGRDVALLGRGRGNAVVAASYAVKHKAAAVLDRSVDGREAALLKGLTLGTRAELEAKVVEEFRAAGAVHLLAISGLHVGFLAFILFLVLRGTRLPRPAVNLIVMAFLPAYALMTGLNPPVVRASLMGVLALTAALLGRDVDLFNVLAAAALVILAVNPLLIADASFLLSFAATFAIAFLYRPLVKLLAAVPGIIRESLAVTFAAQLGVLPLQLYFFFRFTPIALASNLIMVPLAGLAVALSLTTVVAGSVWPALGDLFGGAAWLGAKALAGAGHLFAQGLSPLVARWPALARLPVLGPRWDLQFWLGRPSPFFLLLIPLGVILVATPRRWLRRAAAAAAAFSLALALAPKLFRERPLRLTFLDVGQADSIFVEFPDGENMLVDAGYAGRGYDAGERVVAPCLRGRGITAIDYLCVTHGDGDHAGGAAYIVENFGVRELWPTADRHPSRALRALARAVAAAGVASGEGAPQHLGIGAVAVERLWPPAAGPPPSFSGNNCSTVLRLSYGRFAALLPGDAERPAQELILSGKEEVTADVLKVPHHGSRDAAWPPFVAAVNPRVAVFTTKAGAADFPAPETLSLYKGDGARVFAAGEHGAIIVETDGRLLRLRTMF